MKLAYEYENIYPHASNVIKQDFYVDDLITCTNSVSEALKLKNQVVDILESGKFPLRKWISNCEELLDNSDVNPLPKYDISNDKTVKTLGLMWNPMPQSDVTELPTNRLKQFQRLLQLTQHFLKRWSLEHFTSLQQRSKWKVGFSESVRTNSLVLLREENLPPMQWRLGRIVAVHPGRDNVVRVISVLRSVTKKWVPHLHQQEYHNKLTALNLPTLKGRRHRGDLIQCYRTLSNTFSVDLGHILPLNIHERLRGRSLKLLRERFRTSIRQHFFTNRVFHQWNSLTDYIVLAPSINAIKNRLDNYYNSS
ncbi:hypothetical protein JTB14_027156 [Gonioctena quinquepunctata]|nr:hypothetical protein JTB14_027156 [Gonioctena quinquepunctata]